jgi:hypothetical protein
LTERPLRCPLAQEADALGLPLRQLLYGSRRTAYRILFLVFEDPDPKVRIVAIRYGARRALEPEDLAWLDDEG